MKKTKIIFAVAVFSGLCFSAMAATSTAPVADIATLKEAAAHNDADAAFSLCAAYNTGRGVARDEAEADKWCRKSSQIIAQKSADPLPSLEPAR